MSLKLRLFLSHGAVALVALLVVALGVLLLLRTYADRQALTRLEDMALPIRIEAQALIRNNGTLGDLAARLQEQADQNKAYILLVGADSKNIAEIVPNQPQPDISVPQGFESRNPILASRGRYVSRDGRLFMYVAYQVDNQAGQLVNVDRLILATPQPRIIALLVVVAWPFMIAAGIALIVSLLAALLLARSVYQPLAKVTAAIRRVAGGDYSQRIDATGPEEVAELASSVNTMSDNVAQAQRQLKSFVADVSHELRSPLTSIQGFAQALTDGTATDEATRQKAARIIDQEARRLKKQVDELLELARLETAQPRSSSEPVDIGVALGRSVEVFNVQAAAKQVKLELKTETGLVVPGDADRLEQVFNNLLDNAVKNSPPAGRVSVTGRRVGDRVDIEVSDEGPGIPPDQVNKVFERFYQVAGVRTGVGLGLAIAREIVLAHGGTIEALSEPGQGAKFVVRLPVKARNLG